MSRRKASSCPRSALTILLACTALAPLAAQEPAPAVEWAPYSTEGVDGQPLRGELGRIRVPARRAGRRAADAPTLELAFVRFRTTNPEPGPACIYLVGGPGPSGIEYCVRPATGRMLRLLDTCDVIGIDQRGTGLCAPNLAARPSPRLALPLDRAVTREEVIAEHQRVAELAAEDARSAGIDLRAFDSAESAADVEDIRRALGLGQVMLWGESYGTHLALAYLRAHSQHVARAVLVRVEGPDHTLKLPSTTQRYLEQLHALVAADPEAHAMLPDVLGTVRALLAQLKEEPARAPFDIEGESGTVVVGPFDLQAWLANALGLVFELRDVPRELDAMRGGDFRALGELAYLNRRGELGSLMPWLVDCASGASEARLRRIERERLDPAHLLGDAVNVPYPGVCAGCGGEALGASFRRAIVSPARVLFVSGSLDARTPPDNALEVLRGFENGVHVLVENAGHESLEMLASEYRTLLGAFVRGEAVEGTTVVLPLPRFRGR